MRRRTTGHFGLAASSYTHFTSPIRRYPDLVVHRLLRAHRRGGIDETRREEIDEELPEVARHTSERERRADDAERELLQWRKVRFMADKVGDEFDGYITGVAAFGLFVELVEHFVEGLVHISSMADDYYRYLESSHTLHGENTHKVYRLGDKVRVQLIRVDLERRQIDLGLTEILDVIREGEDRRGSATKQGGAEGRAAAGEEQGAAGQARARGEEGGAAARREVSGGVSHLVVGTAGHIDHGKSTLVQALTGIDPDRLKEEKAAGSPSISASPTGSAAISTSRLSTSPATSGSSRTCSPASAASTRCCWWSPPTKA